METKATIKYLRIGPRKVRPILNLIRNKYAVDAFDILANINKKGARLAEQLLKSVVANAKVKKMDNDNLFISDIRADGGPQLKRFITRSMGRADRILKRTSHLHVVVIEKTRKVKIKEAPEAKEKTTKKKITPGVKKAVISKTKEKKAAAKK